jgi:hypothetical protein
MTHFAPTTWGLSVALCVQAFGIAQEQPPSLAAELTSQTPAQQQPWNPPLSDPELQKREQELERERELQKKEQSSRLLGFFPQFSVTRQSAGPLTPGQKFRLFRKNILDPFVFAVVGLQAGISQARNTFPGWGQGAEGFGKRYGAFYTDRFSAGFFSTSYAVLLKQDPRYFRLGEGSIKHRIGYALAQQFVAKTDKGKREFNYSKVLGALTSGGLSNAYYPDANRGIGLTMSRFGISLLYGSLIGIVNEFSVEIDQKFVHKKKKNTGTP